MRYTISLDVHKRETQACIANARGTIVAETRFRTTRQAYQKALKAYPEGDVIIETVGFYRPVAKWLQGFGYDVHLAHLAKIPKPKQKTDKKDARHNLRLFRGDALPEAYLPPEEVQRLRDLARHRYFLGQQSRRLKAKIKHDLYKHGHFVDKNPIETVQGRAWLSKTGPAETQSCLRLWEALDEELKDFEERIAKETSDHPVAKILMSVPGIGAYTALLIMAEVGDFHRFPNGDALAAYAGLVPSQDQSGDHDRRGHITKEGNQFLQWILVEAAHNHVRHCPESAISRWHTRLIEKEKKSRGKAIIAAARRLCTVLHVIVTREEEFKVNP